MARPHPRRLMWTLSTGVSLGVGMYACGGDVSESRSVSQQPTGGSHATGGTEMLGGAPGGTGVTGGVAGAGGVPNQACTCSNPRCATAQAMCELLQSPDRCPTTIDEVLGWWYPNWIEVGCNRKLVAYFSGTAEGYTYLFDLATGELKGGTRYSDTGWGPCFTSGYSFGDTEFNCADAIRCGPIPHDCVPCMAASAGAAGYADCVALGGSAGAAGRGGSGG